MKYSVIVAGLPIALILLVQSVFIESVAIIASAFSETGEKPTDLGAAGVLMSIAWLFSTAFVTSFPRASAVGFVAIGIACFALDPGNRLMLGYVALALILAGMSWYADVEMRRSRLISGERGSGDVLAGYHGQPAGTLAPLHPSRTINN